MNTPITPIRLPLDLKAKAKKRAENGNLSQYIIELIEKDLSHD